MISFRFNLVVIPLLYTCCALKRDEVAFVRYFVKNWKGYDSVNIFSCPENLVVSDWNILNRQLILSRYIDMRRPIDIGRLNEDQNCRQVYVVDLQCRESVALIRKFAEEKMFFTFCRSFLFLDSNEDDLWFMEVFKPVLADLDLTVTSDVVYASRFPINGTVDKESEIGVDSFEPDFFLNDIW